MSDPRQGAETGGLKDEAPPGILRCASEACGVGMRAHLPAFGREGAGGSTGWRSGTEGALPWTPGPSSSSCPRQLSPWAASCSLGARLGKYRQILRPSPAWRPETNRLREAQKYIYKQEMESTSPVPPEGEWGSRCSPISTDNAQCHQRNQGRVPVRKTS
ncbi:hypothetical protein NDU88_000767 [Pleurodeles waltl]|uniref:Uncharacterized protein n=1 Tax=Pleurodeles waltl TaxID=8319 RepID=A0AAV7R938_PLEWA|nr:hypothetical protein NDU88_000767 [Pleurodeles waltl]